MKAKFGPIVMIVLALVAPLAAADGPKRPLYPYGIFPGLLSKPNVKAELQIDSSQEAAIEAALKKWRTGFVRKTEEGKPIDFAAIEQANFDGMMGLLTKSLSARQVNRLKQLILQSSGMEIFAHRDIREALNLSDAQLATLKRVHSQLVTEIDAGGKAKLGKDEVKRRFSALLKGVPEPVRAALNDEQRQKLQELIGDQFSFQQSLP